MKYFLILGTNPSLSLAETESYLKTRKIVFSLELKRKEVLFLTTEKELDLAKIMKELGGIIKFGTINREVKKISANSFVDIIGNNFAGIDYKFKFGFSFYGEDTLALNSIAMNLKKELKKRDISCRWVTSKEKALSSVVVEQNKLNDRGADFFILREDNKYYLGRTLAVQDFKGLSKRDFGRPARDDESGMLPPKLAQIMLNLSGIKKDDVLLDPFCGSGTVLSEAALMGVRKMIGSDLSQKAIEDTRKNINWLKRTNDFDIDLRLERIDVQEISKKIEHNSVDVIVTEPYLGPQRGAHDLKKTVETLEKLYSKGIEGFSKILSSNGRIVMVLPVFVSRDGEKRKFFLDNIRFDKFEFVPLLDEKHLSMKYINISRKGGIIYGRQGQKVWREIILLKLK